MSFPILVVTNTIDPTSQGVVELLRKKGQEVIVFAYDKVLDGSIDFSVKIEYGVTTLQYDGRTIPLENIGSAWLWHPRVYHESDNYSRRVAVEREMQYTFRGIWNNMDDALWLNPPARIRETQNKISQIAQAQSVGLLTPTTILTNKWKNIVTLGDTTILKMPSIGLIEGDVAQAMHTVVLDESTIARLSRHSPFPGMHQPFVPKKREWRITMVGNSVFPAAIYTELHAKDDWRKHMHDGMAAVTFKNEPLPDATITRKCTKLLKRLGLRYGAFDFIETPEGEIVFLEVNSAGQYGWIEEGLGLPISEAVADLLIDIASRKK